MIKPLNTPQLSAAKPRSGLQSISDLLPRLIRHYEIQAELIKQRSQPVASTGISVVQTDPNQQATFAWYE